MNKKYLLVLLVALLNTNRTHATVNWLISLAADAAFIAGTVALLEKEMSWKEKLEAYTDVPSTIALAIKKDINSVRPNALLLVGAGAAVSIASRLSMIGSSPILGLIGAPLSIPVNVCLLGAAYGLRLYQAKEDAGIVGKKADELWSWWKKQ